MHKISNFTSVRSTMGFGARPQQPDGSTLAPPSMKLPRSEATPVPRHGTPRYHTFAVSFSVPLSSNLAGPDPEDVIHATTGALNRWTHPHSTQEAPQPHQLPIHVNNIESLRSRCEEITHNSDGRIIAKVTAREPHPVPGLAPDPSRTLITNVVIMGEFELIHRMRAKILNENPICLQSAVVDVAQHLLVANQDPQHIRSVVLDHINHVAKWTGTDIFVIKPKSKQEDSETASFHGTVHKSGNQEFRIAIYGDRESTGHAKTRILIMIDQILKRNVDVFRLELSLHNLICGRLRRHIKQIESSTNTAIYFPPPFPELYGYHPPGADRRRPDEIFITGENNEDISKAKEKLHEIVRSTPACVKDVKISHEKVDSIVLERLSAIREKMDLNGSYVLLPQLGVQRGVIRVQATDMLHVERTIRELMTISSQFYTASWFVTTSQISADSQLAHSIPSLLADICLNSGAEIKFENLNYEHLTFHISGPDQAVKAALFIINSLPIIERAQSNLKVKIELANEHKEFVSGKKNGKINKIMTQSNVQVYFDLFNEYNFFIDVGANSFGTLKNGLDLVELEMPASLSFHVPDQYHKRIIGIGGSHIQRIMKKHSVFVKFSNAMDRGGASKDDADMQVDNVICRTPARNAQNLESVKAEILGMVQQSDADFASEDVIINRLYHRELLSRMASIEELERKWNCKIEFPSTEDAKDRVSVRGPSYQIPQAIDELLGMVPESHEITMSANEELSQYFLTSEFQQELVEKLKSNYEVELHLNDSSSADTSPDQAEDTKTADNRAADTETKAMTLSYTRNNAGGLKDAIDFLTTHLVAHGLDASTVQGTIPRPKSDSFEDSLPFFDSKLLHRAEPSIDSPTRVIFSEDGNERSFLDRIRRPGIPSSLTSFLDRRKNGSNSPGGFMSLASANVSKASLASLESHHSRNPWNDSGVNLPEGEQSNGWPARFSGHNGSRTFLGAHPIASVSSLSLTSTPLPPPGSSAVSIGSFGAAGDAVPRHHLNASQDSGRPSTSQSAKSSAPGPIAPPSPAK